VFEDIESPIDVVGGSNNSETPLASATLPQGFLIKKNLVKFHIMKVTNHIELHKEKAMSATVTHAEADVCNFVEALRQLPDHRDNRGKRHALAFVVAGWYARS